MLQLPRVARPVLSLKLPTFYVWSVFSHGVPQKDGTDYCKNVGIILGDPQYAVGTFELVYKLGGMGAWINLPNLRFIDQSDQNPAIGPDR
jgi:hypothetical protein